MKGRVLAIDDEVHVLELIGGVLRPMGLEVDVARDGHEGLERVSDRDYDLILLDVKMPGMDGKDFFIRLRAVKPHLCSRVLFLTGDVISASTMAFIEGTGSPYLAKPFGIEELKVAVEKAMKG